MSTDTLVDSRAWRRLSPRGKIRMALQEIRALEFQADRLQRQVTHAAGATQEMAAHSRALEVQAAARNIESQGIRVFGDVKAAAIADPGVSPSTRKLIDSTPLKELTP